MNTFWGTADFYVWCLVIGVLLGTFLALLIDSRNWLAELRIRWLVRRTARDIARMRREENN